MGEWRVIDLQIELRVGNCYLEVLPGRTGVVAWVLSGVTWSVTNLECYLHIGVLPGRYLARLLFWESFFVIPKYPRSSNSNF